jgi:hypothetical protein
VSNQKKSTYVFIWRGVDGPDKNWRKTSSCMDEAIRKAVAYSPEDALDILYQRGAVPKSYEDVADADGNIPRGTTYYKLYSVELKKDNLAGAV